MAAPLPTVLLLHGLGRTARSMAPLAQQIRAAGFRTTNLDYPSTCHPIDTLVDEHVWPAVEAVRDDAPLHVVTHSLGGILVRRLAERHGLPDGTRVVMIAPPNAGSPVADALRDRWPFRWWCGPALCELGTHDEALPPRLGPLDGDRVEVGVIAGDRDIYPWFRSLRSGLSDGLVTVEGTKLEGMTDFTVVRAGHALIMRSPAVADEVVHFLRHGRFRNGNAGVRRTS